MSPVLLNFLLKILNNDVVLINYYLQNKQLLFIYFLNLFFYFYLSTLINSTFSLNSLSLSITYFLLSFFIFDLFVSFINKEIPFKITITIVSAIWLGLLTIKTINKDKVLKLLVIYLVSAFINNRYFNNLKNLDNYIELNTDVPIQWLKLADLISSKNYYFAFTNNIIDGQSLVLSHIQSTVFNLNFYLNDFQFIRLNSNIFLFFSFLLIYDLNISKKNKIIASFSLFSLLLNSDWLTYLFIDSLMLEGIVSFLFAALVINLNKYLKGKFNLKSLAFFSFFSCLFFTKQFISLISIFLIVYIFLMYRNVNTVVAIVFYFANSIYKTMYTPNVGSFELLNGTSSIELLKDVIFLNNLEFSNIIAIISQLLIDRPVSYLMFLFLLLNVIRILKNQFNQLDLNLIFFIVIINFILIFLLYAVWWKDFGIQSSFRYIMNVFYLLFIGLIKNIVNLEKKV